MPTIHQRRTLQALILAFLTPHQSALPEHNPIRSASSISRFFNHYRWPTRKLVRLTRKLMLEWLLKASKQGRNPYLKVSIDVTCVEKTGRFPGLGNWVNAMNGKTGLQLVMLYLELNRVRVPWNFRIWNGKGTASPGALALRMLSSLPPLLADRAQVVVLADAWFASSAFLEGVHARGYRAVVAIRADRLTDQDRPINRLKRKGTQVMLKGLAIPVWVSWFTLRHANGDRERRFVVSTDPIGGSRLAKLGSARWKIEAFFKTVKYTFSLRKGSQGTRLGMLRFLLLSLLAFVLAFAAVLPPTPGEAFRWGAATEVALVTFIPVVLTLGVIAMLERRRDLLERLGMTVSIHRFQRSAHNCKI